MDHIIVQGESIFARTGINGLVAEKILARTLELEEDRRADDRFEAWYSRRYGIKIS